MGGILLASRAMGYFDHLAIAVDFSEPSKIALAAAAALAKSVNASRLTVLHAVKHVVLPDGDQPELKANLEKLRERIHGAAVKQLDEMCGALEWPEGLQIERRVVEGAPARVVPQAAHEAGATVLLAGTHSRKGLRRWLKGSIAERIVEGAPLPVMILPMGDDGVEPQAELTDLQHVMVAVDAAKQADWVVDHALQAAVCFAEQAVDVTLVTVADMPDFGELIDDEDVAHVFLGALEKSAEKKLVDLEARHKGDVRDVRHMVCHGDVEDEILEAAEKVGARLIVLGSHGMDEAPLLQIGSTTAEVIRNANVSVLVVPSHPERNKADA